MLVESLIIAAGVALASIVALGDNVPIRNRSRAADQHDAPDSRGVSVLDVVVIILFAIAGSLAFKVLANA